MDTEYHLVLFRLASSRIEIHHEYFMYDMVSVVSSIGGGIGIFLGYSCFGILSSTIQNFCNQLKTRGVNNQEKKLSIADLDQSGYIEK